MPEWDFRGDWSQVVTLKQVTKPAVRLRQKLLAMAAAHCAHDQNRGAQSVSRKNGQRRILELRIGVGNGRASGAVGEANLSRSKCGGDARNLESVWKGVLS